MKQSWLVIACVVLMLTACENKNEGESTAVSASPAADEINSMKASDRAVQPVAEENAPKMTTPAAATTDKPTIAPSPVAIPTAVAKPAPVAAKIEKPMRTSAVAQAGILSTDEALSLARKSGCLACHKIETKVLGPAWIDVSKRYKGNPEAKALLVAKVKVGGKGNWTKVTGGVSMPPNSPRVSDENIEKLVTFVLSL